MSDISLTFNNDTQTGDILFEGGDIALDNPLKTALLISLFSDRLAPDQLTEQDKGVGVQVPGNALHSSDAPRKGWWGDSIGGDLIGSRLWQIRRAIRANKNTLLLEVQAIIHEATQWLIDDQIASTINVTTDWSNSTRNQIDFNVSINEPNGSTPQNFQFSLAWQGFK